MDVLKAFASNNVDMLVLMMVTIMIIILVMMILNGTNSTIWINYDDVGGSNDDTLLFLCITNVLIHF